MRCIWYHKSECRRASCYPRRGSSTSILKGKGQRLLQRPSKHKQLSSRGEPQIQISDDDATHSRCTSDEARRRACLQSKIHATPEPGTLLSRRRGENLNPRVQFTDSDAVGMPKIDVAKCQRGRRRIQPERKEILSFRFGRHGWACGAPQAHRGFPQNDRLPFQSDQPPNCSESLYPCLQRC
jgi:hypothetical protein